jgi:pilus assembly protein Flp/PilA
LATGSFQTLSVELRIAGHIAKTTTVRSESMSNVIRFFGDESGATAIEYGLIAAGISVAIITIVGTIGTKLNTTFTTLSNKLG